MPHFITAVYFFNFTYYQYITHPSKTRQLYYFMSALTLWGIFMQKKQTGGGWPRYSWGFFPHCGGFTRKNFLED